MTMIQNPKLRVCEVITHDKELDIHKIRSLISHDHIIQRTIGIPLSQTEDEDSFCWGLTGSRLFTMKSATWAAHTNFDFTNTKWPFNWIWKLDVMPKLRIFLWQTLLNALPVRGVLLRRGMMIDPTCPLCGEDIETIDHLFWECSTTKRV